MIPAKITSRYHNDCGANATASQAQGEGSAVATLRIMGLSMVIMLNKKPNILLIRTLWHYH